MTESIVNIFGFIAFAAVIETTKPNCLVYQTKLFRHERFKIQF
jgi:hypothetical protein